MALYKKLNPAGQVITQERMAQKMMRDALENIVVEAEADGYTVEFFYDEVILTKKKEFKNGQDA